MVSGGLRIVTPLLDRSGLVKLSHACQQASSPELNSLFFDTVENVENVPLTCKYDTDMLIDPALHTVCANCFSTPDAGSVADRVMSLVERTNSEEINVLKSLRNMLKSTVESLPAAPVHLDCAHNGFDLNMIRMEVEGRIVHRQGGSGENN